MLALESRLLKIKLTCLCLLSAFCGVDQCWDVRIHSVIMSGGQPFPRKNTINWHSSALYSKLVSKSPYRFEPRSPSYRIWVKRPHHLHSCYFFPLWRSGTAGAEHEQRLSAVAGESGFLSCYPQLALSLKTERKWFVLNLISQNVFTIYVFAASKMCKTFVRKRSKKSIGKTNYEPVN